MPSSDIGSVPDSLFLEVAQLVGVADGDPAYLFGSISAVSGDAEGRIHVGDRSGATVRAFDADESFLGWIAREGDGPGEISVLPAHLFSATDRRLYIRDASRVTVFGRRAGASVPDSVVALWNVPGGGNPSSARSGVAEDGRYFHPMGQFLLNEPPHYFFTSFRDGDLDGDTLSVPNHPGLSRTRPALFSLGGDALMLRGLGSVPFSAVPVWDTSPGGTLVSSDGASSILLETNASGDTLRTIVLPETPRRSIPRDEAADSLAALEERVEAAQRLVARFDGRLSDATGLGEGVEQRRLPDSLPTVIGLAVAGDGSIWVEWWPPEGETNSRYFDVLDWTGDLRHVAVVRAPLLRDPSPWFGARSIVGIVRDPDTGVEQVARFDLPQGRNRSSGLDGQQRVPDHADGLRTVELTRVADRPCDDPGGWTNLFFDGDPSTPDGAVALFAALSTDRRVEVVRYEDEDGRDDYTIRSASGSTDTPLEFSPTSDGVCATFDFAIDDSSTPVRLQVFRVEQWVYGRIAEHREGELRLPDGVARVEVHPRGRDAMRFDDPSGLQLFVDADMNGVIERFTTLTEDDEIRFGEEVGHAFIVSNQGFVVESISSEVLSLRPQAPDEAAAPFRGLRAPAFSGTDLDGSPYRLLEPPGRIVVLEFWSTQCPFSEEARPESLRLATAIEELGGSYISMARETEGATLNEHAREHPRSGIRLVRGDPSWEEWNPDTATPLFYVIAPDGTIMLREVGARAVQLAAVVAGVPRAGMR